jgi:RNA polymerase sigma-70 factor, ECF subfamily
MPKSRRLSDTTLVRRSQQGDRRAFSALLARYDRRLRGLAHALLLEVGQMDAALSLAYLRAWRDVVRLSAKDDVGAWLYRSTYNACIDQLRRGEPVAAIPGSERGSGGEVDPVVTGLASLAPADRVAVVLVDREGFTPASAARILGLTPSVLTTRLEVARERLADAVGIPPPAAGAAGAVVGDGEPVEVAAGDVEVAAGDGGAAGAVVRDGESAEPAGAVVGDGEAVEVAAGAADVAGEVEIGVGDDGAEVAAGDVDGADVAGVAAGNGEADADAAGNGNGNGDGQDAAKGRGRRGRRRARYAASRQASDRAATDDDDAP